MILQPCWVCGQNDNVQVDAEVRGKLRKPTGWIRMRCMNHGAVVAGVWALTRPVADLAWNNEVDCRKSMGRRCSRCNRYATEADDLVLNDLCDSCLKKADSSSLSLRSPSAGKNPTACRPAGKDRR